MPIQTRCQLLFLSRVIFITNVLLGHQQYIESPRDAIYESCLLRFRPIMMTTMAALLGGLPLAIGGGTGSELRRPLGIAIVAGLIVSQMMTLFTTPVIYLYLDRFRLRFKRLRVGPRDKRIGGELVDSES